MFRNLREHFKIKDVKNNELTDQVVKELEIENTVEE